MLLYINSMQLHDHSLPQQKKFPSKNHFYLPTTSRDQPFHCRHSACHFPARVSPNVGVGCGPICPLESALVPRPPGTSRTLPSSPSPSLHALPLPPHPRGHAPGGARPGLAWGRGPRAQGGGGESDPNGTLHIWGYSTGAIASKLITVCLFFFLHGPECLLLITLALTVS